MNDTTRALGQRLWDYLHLRLPIEKTDFIIGLGNYDLRVADRCAELYHGGWAPLIVFSGHQGNLTRGRWDKSAAEIFAERAIAKGVSADKIQLSRRVAGDVPWATTSFMKWSGTCSESSAIPTSAIRSRKIFRSV